MPTATAALAFRAGMKAAIDAAVDTTVVLVTRGNPGQDALNFDQWVMVEGLSSTQQPATISTNRSREEALTCTVVIECFRPGADEAQEMAEADAYALLEAIEYQVRVTDTTLGGAVRWCFLTSHRSDGFTTPEGMAEGRSCVIEAEFTAAARVTG